MTVRRYFSPVSVFVNRKMVGEETKKRTRTRRNRNLKESEINIGKRTRRKGNMESEMMARE